MNLYLLRHGQAEPQAASDALRALTPRGRAEVTARIDPLRAAGLSLILCSPYRRARETADIIGGALGITVREVTWATPEACVDVALSELQAFAGDTVLLVTHQPFVGELGGVLVHGTRSQPLLFPTAGLALLRGEPLVDTMTQVSLP